MAAINYVVLRLLRIAPMHGYALRQFARGLRAFYPITNPNLYPVLRGIENEGWATRKETVVGGRLRKIYELTAAGDEALSSWLTEAPSTALEISDPIALKVALLTDETAPVAAEWLESEADAMRQLVENGERRIRESAPVMSKYTRSAAEYALELGRARLRWLEDLVERLHETDPGEDESV